MSLVKESLCSSILLDVKKKFAIFLWLVSTGSIYRLPVGQVSGIINIHGNREISFYVAQTVLVVEVANTKKRIDLILRRHCISSQQLRFLDLYPQIDYHPFHKVCLQFHEDRGSSSFLKILTSEILQSAPNVPN